jgi:plasmid stabilization system protein ParE
MNLEILDAAAAEIQHHYDWYHERNPRVAERLADLFETTILQIVQAPLKFSLMEMPTNPGNIRRAILKGFPLYVLYRVREKTVEVFAVPHTSQRPEYWKSRIED